MYFFVALFTVTVFAELQDPSYLCSFPKKQTDNQYKHPESLIGKTFQLDVERQRAGYDVTFSMEDSNEKPIEQTIQVKDGDGGHFTLIESEILGAATRLSFSAALPRGVKLAKVNMSLDAEKFNGKFNRYPTINCKNKNPVEKPNPCKEIVSHGTATCEPVKKVSEEESLGDFEITFYKNNEAGVLSEKLKKTAETSLDAKYPGSKLGPIDTAGWCRLATKPKQGFRFDGAHCTSFVIDPKLSSGQGTKKKPSMMIVQCSVESGAIAPRYKCWMN